jgi:hypothetical protein
MQCLCIVQCSKQPLGSLTCGLYTCEYLRECKPFRDNWRQLKKGLNWWWTVQSDQHCFRQTRADICKFVLDKCVHEGQPFFNMDSPLGLEPEYEKLR